MGNNIDKSTNKNSHNKIIHTPLYSNGTPDMDRQEVVGSVEGPKKPPAMDTGAASIHGHGK